MSLRERILLDLTAAMKSRDRIRLDAIRMVKARILEREVELRGTRGRDVQLDDAGVTAVLGQAAKQRRESIQAFRKGGRDDLAAKEEAELAILESYLPAALDEGELRELVRQAIAETGARGPADLGAVMRAVMPKVQGRADGKEVNAMVRSLLAGGGAPPAGS